MPSKNRVRRYSFEIAWLEDITAYEQKQSLVPMSDGDAIETLSMYKRDMDIDEIPQRFLTMNGYKLFARLWNTYIIEQEEQKMKTDSRRAYYQRMKRRTRNSAIWYQHHFEEITNTGSISVSEWEKHFRKLGKRYGLLREFTENGII